MKKSAGVLIFLIVTPAYAMDPLYVDPPTPVHLSGPPGKGRLKICKMEGGAPDTKNMRVPMGTYFTDAGPIQPLPSATGPQMWRLTVATTNPIAFKPGQKCAVVPARVVSLTPPPFKSVMRFDMADKRYFEISAPADINAPKPDLAPWNPDYPSLEATAESDFK